MTIALTPPHPDAGADALAPLRNKVFNEDIFDVLKRIPGNSLDMVYGDPDYNIGINYAGKSYTRPWDDYLEWYMRLADECMRVLKPDGNLFLMNYPAQNAYLRVYYLDGMAHAVREYVWVYNTNTGHSPRFLTTAHRSILHATKCKGNRFYKEQIAEPYQNLNDRRIQKRIAGGHKGRMPYSWLYHDIVKNTSKDKTAHPCQIPLPLVETLIKSCTKENDDCLILFGGSGNELRLCRELGRNFISAEIHPDYHRAITARLTTQGHPTSHERKINGSDDE